MTEFAGWSLPLRYGSVQEEHKRVRESGGLFDVSHMGEIQVKGPSSLETLQFLFSTDVGKIKKGEAQYSLMLNEKGGILDDLIIYCMEEDKEYLLCVNASNTKKDYNWILKHNKGAKITDKSLDWGLIAVQGPRSFSWLSSVFKKEVDLKPFHFSSYEYEGSFCYVSRTGYTGEKGVEIFVPWSLTLSLWERFFEIPEAIPVGLVARDTLRVEKKFSLYGQDIHEDTNPLEAGLERFCHFEKENFLGKKAIEGTPVKRKLVGFKMLERAIPRQGCHVFSPEKTSLGEVTSGTFSPCLQQGLGMALIKNDFSCEGSRILVEVRGKCFEAEVVKTPFVI